MKKLLIALCSVMVFALSSCNYQVVDIDLKFTKVHIFEAHKCYEIESWRDYEDGEQIQVDIKGYGKVLLSANTAMLIKDKCPICGE